MDYTGSSDRICGLRGRWWLHRLTNSHAGVALIYDLLMRLPLLGWAVCVAIVQIAGLVHYIDIMKGLPTDYVVHVAARVSAIAFLLLVSATVIVRCRPSGKAAGLEPRIAALAGSFLMYGFLLFPRHELSLTLEAISAALILIGTVGAVFALARLGRSFSVMAETRQLVTSGPYRLVRHPLYLTEEIAVIGLFMQFASPGTTLLLALQIGFQLRRMQNEEAVLTASFPEYIEYRQTTACLIPGIY